VAGLKDAAGQKVFGVVFEIAEKDWAIISHKEGGVTGMCVERPVRVQVGNQLIEATAFTTNPLRQSLDGPISSRFVEALTRGAQAAGLPAQWVTSLSTQG
jgi:cation transport regulator ChaC